MIYQNTGAFSIASGVIVNADVNASAAIAGTKISPDFGSQAITTTGNVSAAAGTFTDAVVHNYTSAVQLPVGTTAQRPASPSTGDFRFNSTTTQAEVYDGSSFTAVGSGGGGTGGGNEQIFFESENEMNSSYTISSNHNALVAGPLTIASGATLTINSPSVVTIP